MNMLLGAKSKALNPEALHGSLKTNKVGWGIVARDWKGKLVATWACPSFTCSAPILEEALAIRTAMVKAALEGWGRIIIESDCKAVIDRILKDMDNVVISTALQDIKLLKHNFEECCFSFVRRKFNSVSHKSAKFALNLGSVVDLVFQFGCLIVLKQTLRSSCSRMCNLVLMNEMLPF
ncbi:uncharacterized protein [Coffea arabica]|uniref:RNase H type-1 domain-containing protein n=1 Tax=Coffea arabica TaxID=13443 RepID=A0ABM4WQ46_COFAR